LLGTQWPFLKVLENFIAGLGMEKCDLDH